MKTENTNFSILAAILLISVGSILLLQNFSWFHFQFPTYLITWKLVFVFIAFSQFAKGKVFSAIFWSVVSFFLLVPDTMDYLNVESVFQLWPLLLIGLGIDKILKSDRLRRV